MTDFRALCAQLLARAERAQSVAAQDLVIWFGGKSAAKIAKEFAVHPTTINCIKAGKTWKHVSLQQTAEVVA